MAIRSTQVVVVEDERAPGWIEDAEQHDDFWGGVRDRIEQRLTETFPRFGVVEVVTTDALPSEDDEIVVLQHGAYDVELQEEAADFIRAVIAESIVEIAYEQEVTA